MGKPTKKSAITPAPAVAKGKSVDDFLAEIDALLPVAEVGKRARLSDTNTTITGLQGDLVALRRMLKQYHDPRIIVDERGARLGDVLRSKSDEYKRLLAYRDELEALPDDADAPAEESDDEPEVDA